MNYKHHIIRNFPNGYPLWKKVVANIIFFFGGIIIHKRKNNLNSVDLMKANYKLKSGDVVLVGGLRRLSHLFIGDKVTHSLLYIGRRTFIHSIADGVEEVAMSDVFSEYDTMMILRLKTNKKTIKTAILYAKKQIGKPYDFEFKKNNGKFYCAELIKSAFDSAGFKIKTPNPKNKIIYPADFIGESFKTVFLSHNL